MKKIRLGILSPSEIAIRRFLPALPENVEFVGVAVANESEWFGPIEKDRFDLINKIEIDKAKTIVSVYGGKVFFGYLSLIKSHLIDALYIPLPPALHYAWAKTALEHGYHVLLEKPLATSYEEIESLVSLAKKNRLLIYENYAFEFHKQIDMIKKIVRSSVLGDIHQIRVSFGFPYRGSRDFRYNKLLGGGALNDCGGYPIKLATKLLGGNIKVKYVNLSSSNGHDVDIYGTVVLENDNNISTIASFGMDNAYKCDLEIWGSKNTLYAPRVITPPVDYEPKIILSGENPQEIVVEKDDYFKNSIERFIGHMYNPDKDEIYNEILLQGSIVEKVRSNKTDE